MDLREIIETEPSLRGTLIADLFEIMQDGKFAEVDDPVQVGEEVIGEMTKLERALHTLYNKYAEVKREFVVRAKETCRKCACEEADRAACTLQRDDRALAERCDTVHGLMWGSIQQRLAEKIKPRGSDMAVRTGGQIVLEPRQEQQLGLDLLSALIKAGGR